MKKKQLLKKKNCEYIGFDDRWFMLAAIPVLALVMPAMFFGLSLKESIQCCLSSPIASVGFTALFWLGDRYIVLLHRRRFPLASQSGKRLLSQTAFVTLFTFIVAVILSNMETNWDQHPGLAGQLDFWQKFSAIMFISAFVLTIYEAAYFFNLWKQSIATNEKLKQENIASQLEALKNQVNPHFLFNSLNTLASIIPEDQEKAVEFVKKLSLVYRCILDLKDKSVITLGEELACVENYIFLLKTRFGENLHFDIAIDEAAKKLYLVPMALQMLIENAVKHNVASLRRALYISIGTAGEELVVKNPVQLKAQETDDTKTGLQNIDNRYRLTFGREISVNETKDFFEVRLPLIPIQAYESADSRR